MSAPSSPNGSASPKAAQSGGSPKAGSASPKAGSASPKPGSASPKPGSASPKANVNVDKAPEIDTSLEAWIYNIRTVLHFPGMVLTVAALLVSGTFIESASRKSLEILDNVFGRILGFVLPIAIAYMIDWQTGLLAASVSLILFARLQKHDGGEGFLNGTSSDSVQSTKIVSNTHRWFVEKVLGEMPLAISSDRIQTKRYDDDDSRTSSSSAMTSTYTSDGIR
jgi:hypothetical protein